MRFRLQQTKQVAVAISPRFEQPAWLAELPIVLNSDVVGSTEAIIRAIEAAPKGSAWAIGTELNLVQRLANSHPDKKILFLDKTVCYCSTMNRIDLPHLVWAMESLVDGTFVNQIKVDTTVAQHARVALERMLALP